MSDSSLPQAAGKIRYRKEKEGGNRVILLRMEGLVQRVFEFTGLSDTLPFAD